MGKNKKNKIGLKSNNFIDSAILNDATFIDYLNRLRKVCISMFEWKNLPDTMDSRKIEQDLFMYGQCALLYDDKRGFINTQASSGGYLNIYGIPTQLNCYSYSYQTQRTTYTNNIGKPKNEECILVMNDWDRIPTYSTIELFAYRLYECERTCDVNVKAQKTPVLILMDNDQRLTLENLYSQFDGNKPMIFGDKNNLAMDMIKAIKTDAPFIADKIQKLKKEIWNEALTFLGINNIEVEKKERMVTDEVNQNNELINLNLQSYLAPRQKAAKQFNDKYGFTGTDKEIEVQVRSDLHNIIKQASSVINDYVDNIVDNNIEDTFKKVGDADE